MAVVVGFIGKFPVAGMTYYNLHYIAGLRDLGYDIHYVERQNRKVECYDTDQDTVTDDPSFAIRYIRRVLPRYGIAESMFSFIDHDDHCHGSGWKALQDALDRADFVLTLADETWFDDLERCTRRGFIDGDPVFTQHGMITGDEVIAPALARYPTLFSIGVRIGQEDCTIPTADREWLPARSVAATRLWNPQRGATNLPVTTLMHWGAFPDVTVDGRIYGHKNRELRRFIDLPKAVDRELVLAVGGKDAPREELRARGWRLENPLEATRTMRAYRGFIAGSMADLGIAKHAYVAAASGWFSDRSICFLAAGRPVLHQETGFSDWLPTGEGVFSFSNEEEIIEALAALDSDYDTHCRAARAIAEEYFEASTVLGSMLDRAGFR